MRVLAWGLALLMASWVSQAQTPVGEAVALGTPRPRIALVLSGGGARGFAHVGVLRALKELRVPIDLVAGASMGAVVGGAYAAGRPVEALEQFVRNTDWADILADRPPRDDLAFRRRGDDLLVPSRIEFSVDRSGVRLPPAAVANASLEAALTRLIPDGASDTALDRLPLPFRCVASDLLTGEMVELVDTPLFASMRASLAMPGVFEPIRVQRRLLVDGGLVRNLPVDIARAMGAEVVIAVNVGTPLAGESELRSSIGVARQMLQILTEQNVQRSLQSLRPSDILIAPELADVSFMDFGRSERAMAAGERATRAMAQRLRALALSPEAYAAFEQARAGPHAAPDGALALVRIEVQPTPHAGSEALAARLGLREGEPSTTAQIRRAAAGLLGSGDFERIGLDVRDLDGQRELRVAPVEADWARSRLRLGVELNSDFGDDNQFTLSALHLLSWLNPWGAELRTLARLGSQRSLSVQLWQPLAPGADWYLAPTLQYSASSLDVYQQGHRSLRIGYGIGTAALALGRQFGHWGDLQLGLERRVGSARSLVMADGSQATSAIAETVSYVQLQVDTLDSLVLPSRGLLLQGRVERSMAGPQADRRASSTWLGLQAFRLGDWASHVYGEWSRSRSGLAPLTLGGFLRLSGTPRGSVGAGEVVLGRLVMARRIGEMPPGLGGAVRAGFSLELGAGQDPERSIRLGELRQAGSGFISIDTRFGPFFLAAGATRGTGGTLYLFLGPFW
jgi:NTE family protein